MISIIKINQNPEEKQTPQDIHKLSKKVFSHVLKKFRENLYFVKKKKRK